MRLLSELLHFSHSAKAWLQTYTKILYVKKEHAEHARRIIHFQSLTYLFQDGLSGLISAQHTAKAGQKVLHTHILKAAARVLRYPKIFQAIFPPCLLFTIQLASKSHKTHDVHPDLIFKQKLTSSVFLATKNALLKTCVPLMLLLVIGSVSMVHHCPPSSAAVCVLHHKFLAKGRNLNRKCRKCSKRNCHIFWRPTSCGEVFWWNCNCGSGPAVRLRMKPLCLSNYDSKSCPANFQNCLCFLQRSARWWQGSVYSRSTIYDSRIFGLMQSGEHVMPPNRR